MTDKNKKDTFDPEKDKDVKKGPLKPDHKNQYGEKSEDRERNMSNREKGEQNKKNKP